MNPRIESLVAEQGYFLTRDALQSGVSEPALYRAVRAGRIVRVRHGTYSLPLAWAAASQSERHITTVRSVLARSGAGLVTSHATSAVLHTDDWWGLDLTNVHVTRPGRAERRHAGVVHHRNELGDDDVTTVRGIVTTTPARAAIEVACGVDAERALVLMNALLRSGQTSHAGLRTVAQTAEQWPGALGVRVPLALSTGATGSVGEDRTLFHFWRAGIPRPQLQFPVHDGGTEPFAHLDFWWEEQRLAGEFDGRVKYGRLLKPGQSLADVVMAEKAREDRVREVLDCRFVRIIWADLARPSIFYPRLRQKLGIRRAA